MICNVLGHRQELFPDCLKIGTVKTTLYSINADRHAIVFPIPFVGFVCQHVAKILQLVKQMVLLEVFPVFVARSQRLSDGIEIRLEGIGKARQHCRFRQRFRFLVKTLGPAREAIFQFFELLLPKGFGAVVERCDQMSS